MIQNNLKVGNLFLKNIILQDKQDLDLMGMLCKQNVDNQAEWYQLKESKMLLQMFIWQEKY